MSDDSAPDPQDLVDLLKETNAWQAKRIVELIAERDEAVQLATQGRLAHGVAARQRDEAQAEVARLTKDRDEWKALGLKMRDQMRRPATEAQD